MQRLTTLLELDSKVIDHNFLLPANLAPLPFLGQKRGFLKVVEQRLSKIKVAPNQHLIFVDVFGGSGLLSNRIKNLYPEATVIWNDFDNYLERLDHLEETHLLLEQLHTKFAGVTPKQHSFDDATRNDIKDAIKEHYDNYGYVDVLTIGCNLLFNGNYFNDLEELFKSNRRFYNRLTKKYRSTDGFLHGVERISIDGFVLLQKLIDNLEQIEGQVVLILDPPYISTNSDGYDCDYWKLRDFKPLLDLIKQSNLPYLLFGSGKSNIKELYDLRKECYEAASKHELDLVTKYFSEEPNFTEYLAEQQNYKYEDLHISYGVLNPTHNTRDRLEYAIDNFNEKLCTNFNNQ